MRDGGNWDDVDRLDGNIIAGWLTEADLWRCGCA